MIRLFGSILMVASGFWIVWKLIQDGRDRKARRRYIPGEIQMPEMQWHNPDRIDWNSARSVLVYARLTEQEASGCEVERSHYISGTVAGISWDEGKLEPAEIRLATFRGEVGLAFDKIETAMILE